MRFIGPVVDAKVEVYIGNGVVLAVTLLSKTKNPPHSEGSLHKRAGGIEPP